MLSFTESGKNLYIEVKATAGDLVEHFYLSNNELKKAEELKDKGELYRIYRVYNVGKENIAYEIIEDISQYQVIAKLAVLVRNLEPKQGRIRAEHDFWNEKWIIGHFRRTLISYGLYESGKS